MTKLSVNVNKIATLRNQRPNLNIPDVARLAEIALNAGAAGITVHPRPDQRHIRPNDVDALAALLKRYPQAEYNIEGNPFHNYMEHIRRVRPAQCTLVPDDLSVITSNQGWDLKKGAERIAPVIAELKSLGARVRLFIDPDPEMPLIAKQIGADHVELYTEPYASAFARGDKDAAAPYTATALKAHACGVGLNAGHDLNLQNLGPFLQAVPHILEVSIGHALIADALELGLAKTVEQYARICRGAP
jgi:pyridoxine 5-phosphate synthase